MNVSSYHYWLQDALDEKMQRVPRYLPILCYAIQVNAKYPFLQFLMEKVPFCNNLVPEQFILPSIQPPTVGIDAETAVLQKVQELMNACSASPTKGMEFQGFYHPTPDTPFAVVQVAGFTEGLPISRQSKAWFLLPTEIINGGKCCNIPVDADVCRLFKQLPTLGVLADSNQQSYILPDAVYTRNTWKQAQFQSIFNHVKSTPWKTCGYYYFFRYTMNDAISVENATDKSVEDAINRYALFVEGNMHLDTPFTLTDEEIERDYPEPCILTSSVILVKNYEQFVCLSYHCISTLNDLK